MTSYKEKDYADLIETTKKIGKDVEKMFSKREQSKKSKFEARQASQRGKLGGFYRGGGGFQHLKGQSEGKQQGSQSYEASKPSFGRGSSSSGRGTPFQCYWCGSPDHCMRDCLELGKGFKCFRCGEIGHIATHCTKLQALGASSSGSVPAGRGTNLGGSVGRGGRAGGTTAPGRVFAMTRQNVQATPNVVKGDESVNQGAPKP
ncbi:uncharacterized protein LOC131334124 [Rhododendron vialii]|uniref:uncharacterized protein LOC131334124 n=1 Tax=Rhododendron vialii TaxID=182163 RepID=UPI00265FFD60|nr:uncharacterized protein LOC131334124 [Rhododendron vialii]